MSNHQRIKFITAAAGGVALLVLSGLVFAQTIIALTIATPIPGLFGPILVPAAIVVFLTVSSFIFSDGCGISAILTLSWLFDYLAGRHPPGADRLHYVVGMMANTAREVSHRRLHTLGA